MSTGIGLLITMLIVIFVQPPFLSYISWRYCRMYRTNDSWSVDNKSKVTLALTP